MIQIFTFSNKAIKLLGTPSKLLSHFRALTPCFEDARKIHSELVLVNCFKDTKQTKSNAKKSLHENQ